MSGLALAPEMSGLALSPEMSIAEALAAMTRLLDEADVDQPKREARRLLIHALGIDLAGLIASEARPLGVAAAQAGAVLARRCRREPLSRILGRREFYGLEFELNAATLEPRADTETLVDAVLDHLASVGLTDAPLRLLDLGTGTGAILIALLSQLPNATGLGIDLAPDAVRMAEANASALGFAGRARFRHGDLMEGLGDLKEGLGNLMEGIGERVDILVSNPPYIASGDIAGLEPEVRNHDPLLALDGGTDGLAFYRRILREAPSRLVQGGVIALELGAGQAGAVRMLMEREGFSGIRTARDLSGIERVLLGVAGRG